MADFPRLAIVSDLETFDSDLCVEYLEHIISALGEGEPELHDKLVLGYLKQAADLQLQVENGPKDSAVKNEEETKLKVEKRRKVLKKMLGFLESSLQYDSERILGHMPSGSNPSFNSSQSLKAKNRAKLKFDKVAGKSYDEKEEQLELDEESTILFQSRATLLGRMGQHEGALGIYVHRLKDHFKAEEYCKRVWNENSRREREEMKMSSNEHDQNEFGVEMNRNYNSSSTSAPVGNNRSQDKEKERDPRKEDRNVFLTLLRIYLRPIASSPSNQQLQDTSISTSAVSQSLQLEPALSLISRHSARLDTSSVLNLLPPLVKLKDIHSFTRRALQQSTAHRNEARVLREISQARDLQVEEKRIARLRKRIRVEENRT